MDQSLWISEASNDSFSHEQRLEDLSETHNIGVRNNFEAISRQGVSEKEDD